jgi:hypothetical protein
VSRKRLAALALLLCLSGCGSKLVTGIDSSYPGSYGELPALPENQCPDISGSWSNEGLASYRLSPAHERLLYQLTRAESQPADVTIAATPEQVSVSYFGSIRATFRVNTDFICKEGAVWLKPRVRTAADGTGGYRAENAIGLRKTTKGDLVGEERLASVGAILWVVPVAGSQTYWYLWSPSR